MLLVGRASTGGCSELARVPRSTVSLWRRAGRERETNLRQTSRSGTARCDKDDGLARHLAYKVPRLVRRSKTGRQTQHTSNQAALLVSMSRHQQVPAAPSMAAAGEPAEFPGSMRAVQYDAYGCSAAGLKVNSSRSMAWLLVIGWGILDANCSQVK